MIELLLKHLELLPPANETFPELFMSLQKTAGKYAIASRQSSDNNQRCAFNFFFHASIGVRKEGERNSFYE